MATIAVTVTIYALVPADDYIYRERELVDDIESALQRVGASYLGPQVARGIPAHVSDLL